MILVELDRITTRVVSLNLTRLGSSAATIHLCAQAIVDLTYSPTKFLPEVSATALAAQLTVVVRDYLTLTAAGSNVEADMRVAGLLKNLRRDLP